MGDGEPHQRTRDRDLPRSMLLLAHLNAAARARAFCLGCTVGAALLFLLMPWPMAAVLMLLVLGETSYRLGLLTAPQPHEHDPCAKCGWCDCRGPAR